MEDTTRFLPVELYKVYLQSEGNNTPYCYMRTVKTVQLSNCQSEHFE